MKKGRGTLEKILAFQLQEKEYEKLERIAGNMRIKIQTVGKESFYQTIGDLLKQKDNSLAQTYSGTAVTESMLVMDGFSDKRLDLLLKSLKREQFVVDFKAVTTEVNKRWTVLQMYLEMEKERNAYRKMLEEQKK